MSYFLWLETCIWNARSLFRVLSLIYFIICTMHIICILSFSNSKEPIGIGVVITQTRRATNIEHPKSEIYNKITLEIDFCANTKRPLSANIMWTWCYTLQRFLNVFDADCSNIARLFVSSLLFIFYPRASQHTTGRQLSCVAKLIFRCFFFHLIVSCIRAIRCTCELEPIFENWNFIFQKKW